MQPSGQLAKERFRRYSLELELLLWAVWDPIGGVPLFEYHRYVPQIWRLLEEHAGVEAVTVELERICEEKIEVNGGNNVDAAQRLTEWWYWRFDYPAELAAEDD